MRCIAPGSSRRGAAVSLRRLGAKKEEVFWQKT